MDADDIAYPESSNKEILKSIPVHQINQSTCADRICWATLSSIFVIGTIMTVVVVIATPIYMLWG